MRISTLAILAALNIGCGTKSTTTFEIEPEAIERVKFDQLAPVVSKLIKRAQQNATSTNQPRDYAELFSTAGSIEPLPSGDITWYFWNLPMTDAATAAFDNAKKNGKIIRWPMMAVCFSKTEDEMKRVVVFTQAL